MTAKMSAGVVVLVALVAGGLGLATAKSSPKAAASPTSSGVTAVATRSAGVPRLVDLGAGKCIPCKAMAPILEQLRSDYAGRMDVVFIDVWQHPEQGDAHRIKMIPTQIFYGADGRELARHEGFIDRAQILAQWKALGVEF